MGMLKQFNSTTEFNSATLTRPWVALVGLEVKYSTNPMIPLEFVSESYLFPIVFPSNGATPFNLKSGLNPENIILKVDYNTSDVATPSIFGYELSYNSTNSDTNVSKFGTSRLYAYYCPDAYTTIKNIYGGAFLQGSIDCNACFTASALRKIFEVTAFFADLVFIQNYSEEALQGLTAKNKMQKMICNKTYLYAHPQDFKIVIDGTDYIYSTTGTPGIIDFINGSKKFRLANPTSNTSSISLTGITTFNTLQIIKL